MLKFVMGALSGVSIFLLLLSANLVTMDKAPKAKSVVTAADNGTFSPCKGSTTLNPVEKVRLNMEVTRFFNALGPKTMLLIANKYQLPSFVLYPLGNWACKLIQVVYSYFSSKNDLIMKKTTPSRELFELAERITAAIAKSEDFHRIRHGKQVFDFSWSTVLGVIRLTLPIIRSADKARLPANGHVFLQVVDSFRSLML